MSDWVVSDIIGEDNQDEVSSIAPMPPAPVGEISGSQNPRVEEEMASLGREHESITQLGFATEAPSYQIKSHTVAKKNPNTSKIPTWVLAAIIMAPILLIFAISAISNKQVTKPEDSFLFKTLESKYFTMNYSPDYSIESVVDKKVPFIEKHDLANNIDGQKNLSIVIKDVKFDYSLDTNALARARRSDKNLYTEEPISLKNKLGVYFKKTTENFEHVMLIVDRNKSVLYEIVFTSPSSFADDEAMNKEITDLLESVTFL